MTVTSPTTVAGDVCSPGTHAAIWNLNLSVAGQTLVLPVYLDPTSGAATALGAYQMRICLPPWDTPVGSPGRAFEGAQLLDAKFTVTNIFTAPSAGGLRLAQPVHAVRPRQGHTERRRDVRGTVDRRHARRSR